LTVGAGAVPADVESELVRAADLLDFERTVPRWMAHRRSVSEVFVCGSAALGADSFAVAVQLPRAHALWSDRPGDFHDPLMAVEAGRQTMITLTHAHYGLGRDLMMIARSCTMRVHDREAFRDDGVSPLEGIFLMRLADRQEHRGVPAAMSFEGDLFVGSIRAMTLTGTLVFVPRKDYEILRAHSRARKGVTAAPAAAAPVPVEPALVGRKVSTNVAIGVEDGADGLLGTHPLVVETGNPAFFDHPLDHAPGQLMTEACRQPTIGAGGGGGGRPTPACLVTALRASFEEFAELDVVSECRAVLRDGTGHGLVRADLLVRQLGEKVGDVELELAALPGTSR
jgi:hypothetical protein